MEFHILKYSTDGFLHALAPPAEWFLSGNFVSQVTNVCFFVVTRCFFVVVLLKNTTHSDNLT